jgi:hypothetical protein
MRHGSTIVIGGTRYRWRDLVQLRQAPNLLIGSFTPVAR